MNTKMLIQTNVQTHNAAGSFLRELFQPLVNRFSHKRETRQWLELGNEDFHFFDDENELEEYMISFRQ